MPKRGIEEEEEVSDGDGKKEKSEGGGGWPGGEEAGTRLVPAFHSHWPCRSLYRYLSSFSFFFFSPSSLRTPTRFFLRRKRKEDGESFLIGCPLVSPSPPSPPSSFYFGRLLNVNWIGALQGPFAMKTSPAFALRNSRCSTATGRPRPRVNGPISELFPFYREEFVLAANPHPPWIFFLHSLVFSLSLSLGTYFTLRRVMVHGLLWVSFFFLPLSPPFARFISRFLRGHPVVRTSSAILSVFFLRISC